ncbi:MAG: glutamyl-tRNA reductase [Eubacteriales bacterium]|nr:glutamyl-tRNA reductase [Eubacteriales bacterium]
MNIRMSGLDYSRAPIQLRERLSFTKNQVKELVRRIADMQGVRGAVLLATCNRTELYLSGTEGEEPWRLLCRGAGVDPEPFGGAFETCRGEDAARRLMEVACGLRSQIWGDDQILTQVKTAAALAREAGTADAALETLFRTAAACGKAVKTQVQLTSRPASAASEALNAITEQLGDLHGKKALVIGNGEMGRLAASLLQRAGCQVTVTLRTYRHGETLVPPGCAVTAYESRYDAMAGRDLVVSATTSPHYTLAVGDFAQVEKPPRMLVDLAIPRDIQPEIGENPGVCLLNMDSLGHRAGEGTDPEALALAGTILEEHMARLRRWDTYKESMDALEQVKQAAAQRVLATLDWDMDPGEAAEFAVGRTLELLAGGLSQGLDAQSLQACAEKIRSHSRKRRESHG